MATKKKTKKSKPAKKQVKRPASKKPRPKKYVEPKVQKLPPIESNEINDANNKIASRNVIAGTKTDDLLKALPHIFDQDLPPEIKAKTSSIEDEILTDFAKILDRCNPENSEQYDRACLLSEKMQEKGLIAADKNSFNAQVDILMSFDNTAFDAFEKVIEDQDLNIEKVIFSTRAEKMKRMIDEEKEQSEKLLRSRKELGLDPVTGKSLVDDQPRQIVEYAPKRNWFYRVWSSIVLFISNLWH